MDIEEYGATHCALCRQRITMRGWEPFCCEVCWDSGDAEDHELTVRMLREGGITRAAENPRA